MVGACVTPRAGKDPLHKGVTMTTLIRSSSVSLPLAWLAGCSSGLEKDALSTLEGLTPLHRIVLIVVVLVGVWPGAGRRLGGLAVALARSIRSAAGPLAELVRAAQARGHVG